jgi:hypothetical protein
MTLYSREYDFIYFYINQFKNCDPRVAFMFDHAETLVNVGMLTVDDVAKYANDAISADAVASCFERLFSVSFCASILNSSNLSVSKAATILNSNYLSVSKATLIVDNTNLSASRASTIFSDTNLLLDRVYSILANANLSANKAQSILYGIPLSSRIIDILTYGAGSITYGTNIDHGGGVFYTIGVTSGATINAVGQPTVFIAKNFNCYGTISKSATGGSGGSAGAGAGVGGVGGGGLIIITDNFVNSGVIQANGGKGGDGSTTTSGWAQGGIGGSGYFVRVGTDSAGSGSGGAGAFGPGGGAGAINGGGGGGIYFRYDGGIYEYIMYGGAGGSSSFVTYSDYTSLAEDIKKAAVDWFLVNKLSKNPSTTKSFPNIKGSGGGGGAGSDTFGCCGGGGGGGGQVLIVCVSCNNTGTIRANGGNGGNGGNEGAYDAAGGGGGGGIVYILYKTLTNLGVLQALGGDGGIGDANGGSGSSGTAKASAI